MQDAAGQLGDRQSRTWECPPAKPKTIAVRLHFLSASRKLRIVTNLCVYWDEIFLSETQPRDCTRGSQTVPLLSADLHFRGFSEARIDPRAQAARHLLLRPRRRRLPSGIPRPASTPAMAMSRSCSSAVDDRLVIMGSGDEMRLRFDAAARRRSAGLDARLPAESGWLGQGPRSQYRLLDNRGAAAVPRHEPLSVSRKRSTFRTTLSTSRYRREYNTRPALRLIRPLRGTNMMSLAA